LWYAYANPSDSVSYYHKVIYNFRGANWLDFYGTSTTFIEFLAYPFIKFLSFSYEAVMILFAYFGYLGFVFFYRLFLQQITFPIKIFGFNAIYFVLFLPNFHFWTSSLGKGSVIFLGTGILFFGLGNIRSRLLYVFLGALISYHVRPHVLFVILVSSFVAYTFSSRNQSIAIRVFIVLVAMFFIGFLYQDVLSLTGLDDENILSQDGSISERASDLSRAGSGVDLSNYNFFQKIFTFLFRPLFFDAPGMLGIFVSIENVIYLILAIKLLKIGVVRFIINSNYIVKSALLSFFLVSIFLAQISSNLGLAIRQKSQVMILFMYVILMFMDYQQYQQWKVNQSKRKLL
jgi:hypothetical protein